MSTNWSTFILISKGVKYHVDKSIAEKRKHRQGQLQKKKTSRSAVADEPARRDASRRTAKYFKQSRDHNHAPFVGDMSSCQWTWYTLPVYKIWRL